MALLNALLIGGEVCCANETSHMALIHESHEKQQDATALKFNRGSVTFMCKFVRQTRHAILHILGAFFLF